MNGSLPLLRPSAGESGVSSLDSADTSLDPQARHPQKRRRTDSRVLFPRKRAVTACEACRSRKTKCDNQRPCCGACASSRAVCVFRDQQQDHSTFDSASLAILDRLNYAVQLLENQAAESKAEKTTAALSRNDAGEDAANEPLPHTTAEELPWTDSSLNEQVAVSRPLDDAEAALSDALNISSRPACTHILEWPVFEGRVQTRSVKPTITGSTASAGTGGRIHEDEVIRLVESFLRNVHTKNPVLDPMELLGLARDVTEQGFGWDDASCLVLTSSALGGLSTSWDVAVPEEGETSLTSLESFRLAEAYYTASRKRLGLLETSIIATQCCFLTGVYEMYSMRPLTAWSSFSRACTMLQLHLYAQSSETSQSFTRTEQCLYWSCLKSECEMREELILPPSGLAMIGYPGAFPSPPGATSSSELDTPGSRVTWESVHESSWYYYLSDIAYRRIANRATSMLYSMAKKQWATMGGTSLHRISDELDKQTLQWWENIPGSPSPLLPETTDELTYMLWLDYVDLRERIWRPFVYLAVHGNFTDTDMSLVDASAQKCLDMCFQTLEGARLKHRHHGLWLTIRCMFSKALLIIAAAKSGNVEVKEDWQDRVQDFVAYLRYWEVESPECKGMRTALQVLMEDGTQS